MLADNRISKFEKNHARNVAGIKVYSGPDGFSGGKIGKVGMSGVTGRKSGAGLH
jgi:hypothetical protein